MQALPGTFSETYHTPSQGASLVKAHHLNVGNRFDHLGQKQVNLLTPQFPDASPQREDKDGGQPSRYCCYQDIDHPLNHFPWALVETPCPLNIEGEDADLEQQCKCTEAQQVLQVCMIFSTGQQPFVHGFSCAPSKQVWGCGDKGFLSLWWPCCQKGVFKCPGDLL